MTFCMQPWALLLCTFILKPEQDQVTVYSTLMTRNVEAISHRHLAGQQIQGAQRLAR